MATKKYVNLNNLSTFLSSLRQTFSEVGHKHNISDISDYTVDSSLSSSSSNPVQNKVIDAEFEAVSNAMGALDLAIDGKADIGHDHNDLYYTETEIDTKLLEKSNVGHNHSYNDLTDKPSIPSIDGLATEIYVNNKIAAIPTPDVSGQIGTHNTATNAHNDIRLLIDGLTTRLNTLADSDDTTLDQMSEVVAYIKNNKDLIDSITTSKVNVSDIINNLTTNVSNKPLSAAQGVALKTLIDAITVPTKTSQLVNDSGYLTSYTETDPTVPAWAKAANKPSYTASEVGADAKGSASAVQSNLDVHTANKNNPHGVTLSQLGVNATATELNYVDGVTSSIQTQLNSKASEGHTHDTYMTKANPTGTGALSLNRKADTSVGTFSTAEGYNNTSTGRASHAEGEETTASAQATHAEGYGTTASSWYAHAEGYSTTASARAAHAEGNLTTAKGQNSHAEGFYTVAASNSQHVQGKHNIEDANDVYAHIVGNGDSDTKSNAHTLDWNGNAWYAGTIKIGGTSYADASEVATKTELNGKQNTITGAATTITSSNLTTSRALISDSSGKVAVSAVTSTELGYLDGVTSAIQGQLDGKAASSHTQAASTVTAGTFAGQVVANSSGQAVGTSLLRNSKLVSTETNPTVNGEICWMYE